MGDALTTCILTGMTQWLPLIMERAMPVSCSPGFLMKLLV